MSAFPQLEAFRRIRSGAGATYRVIQPLGQGGNSHVYLVEAMTAPFQGLLFALKLFVKVSDATRLKRFSREVEFFKKCQHPAIMRVYDLGEIDEAGTKFPFVIADYLPRTLYDAMRSGLTMMEKTSFVLQLLSAAAYMEKEEPQIVHRDIKPENIFVRGKGCILGDFGLMKILEKPSKPPEAANQKVGVAAPKSTTAILKVDDESKSAASADSIKNQIVIEVAAVSVEEEEDREHVITSTGPRLPRFYRTPDLVDYCRKKGELTTKSDVFQLGLVFTELFSGKNPLKAAKHIYDPIELDPMGEIPGSQASAIKAHLKQMLELNPANRPAASELFDPWEGIFKESAQISLQLEGRVF